MTLFPFELNKHYLYRFVRLAAHGCQSHSQKLDTNVRRLHFAMDSVVFAGGFAAIARSHLLQLAGRTGFVL